MSQLVNISDSFIRRVVRYRKCCTRIEEQYTRHRMLVTDVELVYCSSYLSVCAQWESLLEQIIVETACGERSKKTINRRLASLNNRKILYNILLFPEKDYISIQSIKRAEAIASLFINQGRPISAIEARTRTLIQQAIWIRNAIAHESSHAKTIFREKVPGVASLPRAKRYPGAFLRHEFRQSPKQRRYELYFSAFQQAALNISAAW